MGNWYVVLQISPSLPHSPHVQSGEHVFDNAMKVYYRALRDCPYSKRLWLDMLELLLDGFEEKEVRDLLDVMVEEKEIYLRTSPASCLE